jgi:methyl-accepting chemotaxis protein
MLSRMRFAWKFVVGGMLFVLPLSVVFFYFQSEINKGITFAQLERKGVLYERPTIGLVGDLLALQQLATDYRLDHSVTDDQIAAAESKVDSDIRSVDAQDKANGAALSSTDAWNKIKAQWPSIKAETLNGSDGSLSDQGAYVDGIVSFIQTIGNNSNLILDPQIDSYYTMDSVVTQTPSVLVGVSRARNIAAAAAVAHSLSAKDATQLTVLTGLISTPLSTLQGDVQQVEQFNSKMKARLDSPQSDALAQTNAFVTVLQNGFLASGKVSVDVGAVRSASASAGDSLAKYRDTALPTLDYLLGERLQDFLVRRAAVDLCVVVFLLLAAYMFAALSYSTTKTLSDVSERMTALNGVCIRNLGLALKAMEAGDLTFQIESTTQPIVLSTSDELGEMAGTFNQMLEQTRATIDSFRGSQESVSELVRHLQALSGDVGRHSMALSATATEAEASGSEITQSVKEIASASNQAAQGAEDVAKGNASQASSVAHSADLVRQLSSIVHSVAANADAATQAVATASTAADEGTSAVGESLGGMESIRARVLDSAHAITELKESSARIGAIVGTIEDIADQTNLLALNAAIEAARAGEAGRGFAVVADEVRKLAERSRGATSEVNSLVKTVQSHTADAVAAMDHGVREVENGSELANKAGEALVKIMYCVADANQAVTSILEATQEMTGASEQVLHEITEVAAVVEESSAAAEEMSASSASVAESIEAIAGATAQQEAAVAQLAGASQELSDIARDLEESASRFRVGDEHAGNGADRVHLKAA